MFLSHWKKSAAVFAALFGISSAVFLGGCGMWKSGVPKEDAVNMAEASSVKVKDPNFKPGTAIVHRDADVEYSVPEGVSILMYHMIGDMKNNSAVMTEDNLRIQMQYLKDHGYHPITMQELYDYVTKGEKLPSKPVCITFDDGYLDSYTIVYPMMKEFGYPWTLFLITDDVGKSYNRMTWEQLKEMADSGAVTIANHTLSHPKLHNLPTRAE